MFAVVRGGRLESVFNVKSSLCFTGPSPTTVTSPKLEAIGEGSVSGDIWMTERSIYTETRTATPGNVSQYSIHFGGCDQQCGM